MTRARKVVLTLVLIGAAGGASRLIAPRQSPTDPRAYRIGYGNDLPFHFRGADGKPGGIAVEIVRAAAARAGVRLEWREAVDAGIPAIRSGEVDFWVLLTDLPERHGLIHFTEPFLSAERTFVVVKPPDGAPAPDLTRARIGYRGRVLRDAQGALVPEKYPNTDLAYLQRYWPAATPRPIPYDMGGDPWKYLDDRQLDALLLNKNVATGLLLAARSQQDLRMLPAPESSYRMAIGSSFETGGTADRIRDEIRAMSEDGSLAELVQRWGYFQNLNLGIVNDLAASRRHARDLELAALVLLLSLVATAVLALRLSRQRAQFAAFMDNLPGAAFVKDQKGDTVFANRYLRRLLGDAGWPRRPESGLDAAAGAPRETDQAVVDARGESRTFRTIEFPVPVSRTTAFRGAVALDITDRLRAEELLRASEEKFATLFRCSPAAIAIADPVEQYRLLDVNDAYERLTGRPREEVIGRSLRELGSWPDPSEYEGVAREMRERGRLDSFECRIRRQDGQIHTVLASTEAVTVGGRALALLVATDVTESKRAAEQLRQAQKMESIGRLAGGIAHDFNNLLTIINGNAGLLARDAGLPPGVRGKLDAVCDAGARAAGLTQQLLAFGRKQVFKPRPLDVNEVVTEISRLIIPMLGEDVRFSPALSPGLRTVMADADQLHQVIMNLALNARDAMPHGGDLTIETANVAIDPPSGAGRPDVVPGEFVMLAVSDTGVGMDAETRQMIFEPFFTTKGVGHGTGLGLASVEGIVRQSGGWVSVRSEIGKGSTFEVYLPSVDTPAEPLGVPEPPTPEAACEGTILVVEDLKPVREFTAVVLGELGYRVLPAADGEEALRIAAENEGIDLLLTDVMLPGMTGPQLASRLQASFPGLKVLYASGYTEDVVVQRGALGPGSHYLAKPYTPAVLASRVRELMQ